MTVPSEQSRIQYTTDGTSVSFPVPFRFLNAAHLQVARQHNDGSSILELGVDYSVSGVGNQAGGTITTTTTLPAGDAISIERVVPITQETAYQRNDPFPERAHEQALDKLTMICQMLGGVLGLTPGSTNRALLLGKGDIDGFGAYRANGNRIRDLGAPKSTTDAARLQDIIERLSDLATDGSGQFVVERLADRVDPSNGAGMVALKHGGTVADAINYLTPEMYGAKGDGVEDDSIAFQMLFSDAALTSMHISCDGSKTYYLASDSPLVKGNIKIFGNGAEFKGNGETKILRLDGSLLAHDVNGTGCQLFDLDDVSDTHDYLELINCNVVDGQIVHGQQTDTSKYYGYKSVNILRCKQDNEDFAARKGITLFFRRLKNVSANRNVVTNSLRRGIIIGQNDATYRCDIEYAEANSNNIKRVRDYDGLPEAQGIEINDAYTAWQLHNRVEDIQFMSGVPATGAEGLYIRGGLNGFIMHNALVDAGGGQGNILLKSERFGIAAHNSVTTTDIRAVNAITGMYSRHHVFDNQIIIYGTPEGEVSRGIWLGYESGYLGDYVDMTANNNKIYFRGNGKGREVGIDFYFGNSTGVTSAYCDGNYIRGNSSNPIFAGIKSSNGGYGLELGSRNKVENAITYLDVYLETPLDSIRIKGEALNIQRLVDIRSTMPKAVGRLTIKGMAISNTREPASFSSLVDVSRVEKEVISKGNEYRGYISRVFNQFSGELFWSDGDIFRPSTDISSSDFFRLFDAKPNTVRISNGDFTSAGHLVVVGLSAGIDVLWVSGNDLTGTSRLPSERVTKKIYSNNLGVDV